MTSYRLSNRCSIIKNKLQSCELNSIELYNTNHRIKINQANKKKYDILEFDKVSSQFVPPTFIQFYRFFNPVRVYF